MQQGQDKLGLSKPTSLTWRVLENLNVSSAYEFLHALTARGSSIHPFAEIVSLLFDEAGNGDTIAKTIVEEHGKMLLTFTNKETILLKALRKAWSLTQTS